MCIVRGLENVKMIFNFYPNIGQYVFSDGQNHILNPYQRQYLSHNIPKSKSG